MSNNFFIDVASCDLLHGVQTYLAYDNNYQLQHLEILVKI